MLRIFIISWALVCGLSVSSGLQAEENNKQPSAEQREELASTLLKIQVHILALSPHVSAPAFTLLAEVSDPAIADAIVAETAKSIMLKAIAKNGKQAKDNAELKKQMQDFAKKIGVDFEQLMAITEKGTDDRELLEKFWQQEQISAEEWVAINAKVREAMISEQRLKVLNEIPVQLYRNFAVLAVAGRGIIAKQTEHPDGKESKMLGTDHLFKAIKGNYDALVEFGLEEGLLTPEKYAAPEALTNELAASVDTFVDNINARSRHVGTMFFTEKVSSAATPSDS